jgi:hypothetical protein
MGLTLDGDIFIIITEMITMMIMISMILTKMIIIMRMMLLLIMLVIFGDRVVVPIQLSALQRDFLNTDLKLTPHTDPHLSLLLIYQ